MPNQKLKAFKERLPDFFDCTHMEALTLMMITKDREFLLVQGEKERRGFMMWLDKKLEEALHQRERATACDRFPVLEVDATVELKSSMSEPSSPSCWSPSLAYPLTVGMLLHQSA